VRIISPILSEDLQQAVAGPYHARGLARAEQAHFDERFGVAYYPAN